MARLRVTALKSESGAPYYRRAGRCFAVGQVVEVEVSAADESLLRGSKRLRVEAVEQPAVEPKEDAPPSTDRSPAEAEKPKAKGRKSKSEPSDS